MDFEEIKAVGILVELKDGSAHQVLSSKENKELVLKILSHMDGGLNLSKELEPVKFKLKENERSNI